MADLVAQIKKDPGNFPWWSQGGAGVPDLISRKFFKAIGVDVRKTKPIVGQSGAQAAMMIAGGHVQMAVTSTSASLPIIKGGNGRALMINSAERDPDLPDVPSRMEAGLPSVDVVYWLGFSGPPKMPAAVVDIWEKAVKKIIGGSNLPGPAEKSRHCRQV